MSDLLNALNEEQRLAVENIDGYVRLHAGAGTGKTRTLTYRYAYLVSELGIPAKSVWCCTFTNKAASEMKSRILSLCGDVGEPFVSTFHSFCVSFLKEEIMVIGWPKNFTIWDVSSVKSALRPIYDECHIDGREFPLKKAWEFIDGFKEQGEYITAFIDADSTKLLTRSDRALDLGGKIFWRYLFAQRTSYALDFDDLILLTLYILKNFPKVRERWQERLEYIMVDEFQDIDRDQYELVEILAGKHHNLFIVGDPDQTIYSWRGARVEYFNDFIVNHGGKPQEYNPLAAEAAALGLQTEDKTLVQAAQRKEQTSALTMAAEKIPALGFKQPDHFMHKQSEHFMQQQSTRIAGFNSLEPVAASQSSKNSHSYEQYAQSAEFSNDVEPAPYVSATSTTDDDAAWHSEFAQQKKVVPDVQSRAALATAHWSRNGQAFKSPQLAKENQFSLSSKHAQEIQEFSAFQEGYNTPQWSNAIAQKNVQSYVSSQNYEPSKGYVSSQDFVRSQDLASPQSEAYSQGYVNSQDPAKAQSYASSQDFANSQHPANSSAAYGFSTYQRERVAQAQQFAENRPYADENEQYDDGLSNYNRPNGQVWAKQLRQDNRVPAERGEFVAQHRVTQPRQTVPSSQSQQSQQHQLYSKEQSASAPQYSQEQPHQSQYRQLVQEQSRTPYQAQYKTHYKTQHSLQQDISDYDKLPEYDRQSTDAPYHDAQDKLGQPEDKMQRDSEYVDPWDRANLQAIGRKVSPLMLQSRAIGEHNGHQDSDFRKVISSWGNQAHTNDAHTQRNAYTPYSGHFPQEEHSSHSASKFASDSASNRNAWDPSNLQRVLYTNPSSFESLQSNEQPRERTAELDRQYDMAQSNELFGKQSEVLNKNLAGKLRDKLNKHQVIKPSAAQSASQDEKQILNQDAQDAQDALDVQDAAWCKQVSAKELGNSQVSEVVLDQGRKDQGRKQRTVQEQAPVGDFVRKKELDSTKKPEKEHESEDVSELTDKLKDISELDAASSLPDLSDSELASQSNAEKSVQNEESVLDEMVMQDKAAMQDELSNAASQLNTQQSTRKNSKQQSKQRELNANQSGINANQSESDSHQQEHNATQDENNATLNERNVNQQEPNASFNERNSSPIKQEQDNETNFEPQALENEQTADLSVFNEDYKLQKSDSTDKKTAAKSKRTKSTADKKSSTQSKGSKSGKSKLEKSALDPYQSQFAVSTGKQMVTVDLSNFDRRPLERRGNFAPNQSGYQREFSALNNQAAYLSSSSNQGMHIERDWEYDEDIPMQEDIPLDVLLQSGPPMEAGSFDFQDDEYIEQAISSVSVEQTILGEPYEGKNADRKVAAESNGIDASIESCTSVESHAARPAKTFKTPDAESLTVQAAKARVTSEVESLAEHSVVSRSIKSAENMETNAISSEASLADDEFFGTNTNCKRKAKARTAGELHMSDERSIASARHTFCKPNAADEGHTVNEHSMADEHSMDDACDTSAQSSTQANARSMVKARTKTIAQVSALSNDQSTAVATAQSTVVSTEQTTIRTSDMANALSTVMTTDELSLAHEGKSSQKTQVLSTPPRAHAFSIDLAFLAAHAVSQGTVHGRVFSLKNGTSVQVQGAVSRVSTLAVVSTPHAQADEADMQNLKSFRQTQRKADNDGKTYEQEPLRSQYTGSFATFTASQQPSESELTLDDNSKMQSWFRQKLQSSQNKQKRKFGYKNLKQEFEQSDIALLKGNLLWNQDSNDE